MIDATQHLPAYVSGLTPCHAIVRSTPELLALGWVQRWADRPNFHRWSVSDGTHLMAEMSDGTFWVVAFLAGDPVELPAWRSPMTANGSE